MRKLQCLILVISFIVTLSLIGCDTCTTPTSVSPNAPIPPAGTVASKQVKIVWWHVQPEEPGKSVWQDMADAYMQGHPNVTIVISATKADDFKVALAKAIRSGNGIPDLFQSWGGGVMLDYANAGILKDIGPDLQGNWGNSFNKVDLEVYGDGSKYYGVPWDMGAVGFWYNKALFSKAGITRPPPTWSELLVDVGKLKAAGITPISLGDKDKWPGHFWWVYLATRSGGKPAFARAYNRTGSFADPSYVEAGKKLQDLIALKPFPDNFLTLDYTAQAGLMGDSKAGMELMGQWARSVENDSSATKKGIGADLGFFPFPSVEGGAGSSTDVMGGGNGFTVSKNAPPETVDFLKFLTSTDNQRIIGQKNLGLPAVRTAQDAVIDPQAQQVLNTLGQAKYFQLYYDQFLPSKVGDAVKDATFGIFAGTTTPDQAAKSIDAVAATELKK